MDEVAPNQAEALDIARQLINAGVPVFAAEPVADKPGHYHLPKHWEKTVPAHMWLNKWRPGWALAAVGGHVCDFLDVDPRNDGDSSLAEIQAAGHMPRFFGQQETPSGGDHYVISPTGERKSTGFMPGLDLQSGAPDGAGRGFVWIAPTVRPSKDPTELGALKAYRWVKPPDMDLLAEFGHDTSTEGIVSRIQAKRAAPKERLAQAIDPDDPFMTNDVSGAHGGDRSFTADEAREFARPYLMDLQGARIGVIEEECNTAATVLSHFVPEFWSVDQAMGLLEIGLSQTAYDPNGPSDWTVEKFRAVLDGRRRPLDPWKAVRRLEPPAPPVVTVEAEPGEESLTTLEKLTRKLVSASELADMPAPEPLVEGLLDRETECWMIGAPGSFKSFVALDIAGHVGRGAPWQGRRTWQGPALYLAAEGVRGMVLRTRAWREKYGRMDGVTFLPYPVKVQSQDGQWAALVEIARELKPALVVIDTQARVTTGLEENSAKDMSIFTDAVGAIKRATGACVLVLHHTGRNGGDARGSSAIDGAQDTELKMVRDKTKAGGPLLCRVLQDKQKDKPDSRDGDGIPLLLEFKALGSDPITGQALSSLVLASHEEAVLRRGELVDPTNIDVNVWRGKTVEPWTGQVPGVSANAKVKRRIIQALADHAHDRGLTDAQTLKVVTDRWEAPDPTNWRHAWNAVTSLAELVVNIGGERFALDVVKLNELRPNESDMSG